MGTYLNPGSDRFEGMFRTPTYVDKTEMINFLNSLVMTTEKYVCVTRPRRFGKSCAAAMICSYYGRGANSRELFSTCKLATSPSVMNAKGPVPWDAYLGNFDVIRLVMTNFFKMRLTLEEGLSKMQRLVVRDLKRAYPDVDYLDEGDLIQSIDDAYEGQDRKLVVVIDEWDVVFRLQNYSNEDQKRYLQFLRDLLKDNDHVALAYMTGILPIKKYGNDSALNMFTEYTMLEPAELAPYTGLTEDEVMELCEQYGRNFAHIKEWYDGYVLHGIVPKGSTQEAPAYSLYCPLSVSMAVARGKNLCYWNQTIAYQALADYVRFDFDGLRQAVAYLMEGKSLTIDPSTYANDRDSLKRTDDVLTMLVHLGYLSYDSETSKVRIPNKEVMEAFNNATRL